MEMSFKRTIGVNNYQFTVSGENLHDLVMQSQNIGFQDIDKCGKCGKTKLYFKAYVTEKEGYKYVKVVCAACKASVTFGQVKKNPNTYFLRKNEDGSPAWQEFEDHGDSQGAAKKPADDVPF